MSHLSVPTNQTSGKDSAGLSEILNEMEKKLDSAQRRYDPKFGASKALDTEVNQFDIDFEHEV